MSDAQRYQGPQRFSFSIKIIKRHFTKLTLTNKNKIKKSVKKGSLKAPPPIAVRRGGGQKIHQDCTNIKKRLLYRTLSSTLLIGQKDTFFSGLSVSNANSLMAFIKKAKTTLDTFYLVRSLSSSAWISCITELKKTESNF